MENESTDAQVDKRPVEGYMTQTYTADEYMRGEQVETIGIYLVMGGAIILLAGIVTIFIGRRMKEKALRDGR